ncbi:hypothetical protein [Burkholderia cenocepacia]|uniref:hypothetical protein n=1 Tax=Burkholderia cenocepacia TaxID=95486 RepID=UPI0008465223|nr:hypothetical protein [Burkholderia cenocepacia]
MSTLDYLRGQQVGATSATAGAARRANAVAAEWRAFSEGLQGRLDKATEGQLFASAQLSGATALAKALVDELSRVAPNSPLLNPQVRERVMKQGMAKNLAKNGYDYDMATNRVSKR